MEKLALCSKVLYDIDLLNKQKEIYELKKTVNTPKIYIQNNELWQYKKKIMYDIIKTSIDEYILEEFDDYDTFSQKYPDSRPHSRGWSGQDPKDVFDMYKDTYGNLEVRTKKGMAEQEDEDEISEPNMSDYGFDTEPWDESKFQDNDYVMSKHNKNMDWLKSDEGKKWKSLADKYSEQEYKKQKIKDEERKKEMISKRKEFLRRIAQKERGRKT